MSLSAFAGLSANTPFYNVLLGIAMWFGRFAVIVAVLAMAGSLAAKRRLPAGPGSMPTTGPLFVTLLIGAVVWAYLGILFEFLMETVAWERWEGTIEYTFMAPLSRAMHLAGQGVFAILYGLVRATFLFIVCAFVFFDLQMPDAKYLAAFVVLLVRLIEVVADRHLVIEEGHVLVQRLLVELLLVERPPELVERQLVIRGAGTQADDGRIGGLGIAEAAIAETGSVIMSEPRVADRAVTLMTGTLVIVCPAPNLLPSLDEAAGVLRRIGTSGSSYATFITGPSRTADIERQLTVGVQGPGVYHVILVDQLT